MRSWLADPRLGVAAAFLALACAGGTGGSKGRATVADTSQFPSRQELEKLGASPAPESLFGLDMRRVESWDLAGPFPETVADEPFTEPGNPWAELLEQAARRRAGLVLPTQSMFCVARELGRFQLAHRGQPTPSLRYFITARCNASVADVSFQVVEGPVSPGSDDAAVFAHWKSSVDDAIRTSLEGGPRTAGIWFGRDGDQAVAMVAAGHRELVLEPFSPAPGPDGALEIRGESLAPVKEIGGLFNRGRFGVGRCEAVGDAKLPSFHLRCPLDPGEGETLISLTSFRPDRLLGSLGLLVLASPGGGASTAYRRPVYGESWPMLDAQNLAEGFVDLLNSVRREARLDPLVLDAAQSEMATELAPHFFAASYGQASGVVADMVVLGMLAGWTVDGIVQAGHFASAWALRTTDLSDLLATALEFPWGREALLADDVERIAIGPMLATEEGKESVAAVFGTYSLFSEKSHDAMARRVVDKLAAERRRRGVEPPEELADVTPLCQRIASAVQAGEDPTDALDALLQGSVDVLQRPVAGWIAEVSEIDGLDFPEEYLRRPSLDVAVAVSHRRKPGDPWGRYVVMLVIADPDARGV
jgi:hypothetical protein